VKNEAAFEKQMTSEGSVSALYKESTLANALTEVVKLGAADFATVGDFDLGDTWCVERKDALYTFAVGNLTDGESGIQADTTTCNHETGKDLDTLFVTFLNAAMNLDGVAYVELGDVLLHLLLLDLFDDVHGVLLRGKIQWWREEIGYSCRAGRES